MPEPFPTPTTAAKPAPDPTSERLLSLDVLRGIDMFWIIGGSDILTAATATVGVAWVRKVVESLTNHVEWEGFHLHDGIFPLFLFLIGATLPWSLGRRVEAGESKRNLVGKIVTRTCVLTFFGLVVNGILDLPGWDNVRFFGVLQRQAAGFFVAALLFLFTNTRIQAILVPVILIVYTLLLHTLPLPGAVPGSYAPETNVAYAFDRWVLQPGQRYEEFGDPEGPLSHIPGVATALMGLLAGTFLRHSPRSGASKAGILLASGVLVYLAGWALGPVSPIVKKIWSPTFILVSGGLSAALLGAVYWICDVRRWRFGSGFWTVIGTNAIVAYMAVHVIDFDESARRVFGGLGKQIPSAEKFILAAGAFALVWAMLRFLNKHRILIRV